MDETPHSAVGSALGYYYQAIYALIFLFDADENASVGIETLDDVTITNGEKKELHQLKHSIQENPKISLKVIIFGVLCEFGAIMQLPNLSRKLYSLCQRLLN